MPETEIDDWDKPHGRCRACGARLNAHLMPASDYPNERPPQPTIQQIEMAARAYWDAELVRIKLQVARDAHSQFSAFPRKTI